MHRPRPGHQFLRVVASGSPDPNEDWRLRSKVPKAGRPQSLAERRSRSGSSGVDQLGALPSSLMGGPGVAFAGAPAQPVAGLRTSALSAPPAQRVPPTKRSSGAGELGPLPLGVPPIKEEAMNARELIKPFEPSSATDSAPSQSGTRRPRRRGAPLGNPRRQSLDRSTPPIQAWRGEGPLHRERSRADFCRHPCSQGQAPPPFDHACPGGSGRAAGPSPTSSRKGVPPWAALNRPSRRLVAPVNAPRSYPNSSDSISVSGKSAQLTATNGVSRRSPIS